MTKIEVENVIRPGPTRMVDAEKYAAMRDAYLAILPPAPPGLTPGEILTRLIPRLDTEAFPGAAKARWWAKTVQLDLEAKGVIARAATGRVRLFGALDGVIQAPDGRHGHGDEPNRKETSS